MPSSRSANCPGPFGRAGRDPPFTAKLSGRAVTIGTARIATLEPAAASNGYPPYRATGMNLSPRSIPKAILCGGFIAGAIDIGAASVINWLSPLIIMQAIASGVLGKASFQGGLTSAALGLVLQWAMSILIAAIYVLAATRIPRLGKHWVPCGLLYGVVVYFVMTYVVVPLSAAGFSHA